MDDLPTLRYVCGGVCTLLGESEGVREGGKRDLLLKLEGREPELVAGLLGKDFGVLEDLLDLEYQREVVEGVKSGGQGISGDNYNLESFVVCGDDEDVGADLALSRQRLVDMANSHNLLRSDLLIAVSIMRPQIKGRPSAHQTHYS